MQYLHNPYESIFSRAQKFTCDPQLPLHIIPALLTIPAHTLEKIRRGEEEGTHRTLEPFNTQINSVIEQLLDDPYQTYHYISDVRTQMHQGRYVEKISAQLPVFTSEFYNIHYCAVIALAHLVYSEMMEHYQLYGPQFLYQSNVLAHTKEDLVSPASDAYTTSVDTTPAFTRSYLNIITHAYVFSPQGAALYEWVMDNFIRSSDTEYGWETQAFHRDRVIDPVMLVPEPPSTFTQRNSYTKIMNTLSIENKSLMDNVAILVENFCVNAFSAPAFMRSLVKNPHRRSSENPITHIASTELIGSGTSFLDADEVFNCILTVRKHIEQRVFADAYLRYDHPLRDYTDKDCDEMINHIVARTIMAILMGYAHHGIARDSCGVKDSEELPIEESSFWEFVTELLYGSEINDLVTEFYDNIPGLVRRS